MIKFIAAARAARRQATRRRVEQTRAEYNARFQAGHGRARVAADEGMYV